MDANPFNLYERVAQLSAEGRAFVLATVIESHGSTPQKPGSKMVVMPDGSTVGTVGGGAVELQIIEAAKALFGTNDVSTTIETHLTHDLGMCCGGKMRVFLEKHAAVPELFIFGAGHVAKELAALAKQVDFRVTVVDARPEWLTAERFPHVDARVLKDPETFARALEGGEERYVCIATHDHPLDQLCVEALLRKPLRYLGVIGSRRKAERFKSRLLAAGFSAAEVERMRTPMGLPIQALTPAEIAVSVVGELISRRRANAR